MRARLAVLGSAVALALVTGTTAGTARQDRGWELLGQRMVTDRADHDLIPVTASRGDFKKIKVTVARASVDFRRMVVHFGNGADQDIELRHTIPAGGESRVIDLEGGDRVIRSVELWYDANTIRGRRAMVRVYGQR